MRETLRDSETERDGEGNRERDKGSEGVGSKRKGGSTEQRVLSLFVGKCLRDGSLLTEFVLIHQSQKKHYQPLMLCVCVCVCVFGESDVFYETGL